MTTFRTGLFVWGLLVVAAGTMLIYSATIQPLSAFQVIVIALAAAGLILAISALIPRSETSEVSSEDSAEPSELLDSGVGEDESLDAGGTEIDLGNRRG